MAHRQITYDNFYTNTFAVFKACKTPKRKPDFTSYKKYFDYNEIPQKSDKISSEYWYGEDSKGKFIIRNSNHWSARNSVIDCINVASCIWELSIPKQSNAFYQTKKFHSGKAYLTWFKPRN